MSAERARPAQASPAGWHNAAFACAAGLYFSLLQFSYFFLLEAFLSSQAPAYFVALFFWLCGFWLGLNINSVRVFVPLQLLSLGAYYASYLAIRIFPFNMALLPAVAACLLLSGLAPGYFFTFCKKRFARVKSLLLHENNGFILGIVLSLLGAIYAGRVLINWAPLAGIVGVFVLAKLTSSAADPPKGANL